MLATITIKLTRPFLGSAKPNQDGIREIIKTDNNPTLFIKRFCKLCKKYAIELGVVDYRYNTINVPNFIKTDSKEKIYEKEYKDKDGYVRREKFMSYPSGTLMTLDCYIDTNRIDAEKAIKILELIGKYDGISQFGIHTNFGRFEILICTQQNND